MLGERNVFPDAAVTFSNFDPDLNILQLKKKKGSQEEEAQEVDTEEYFDAEEEEDDEVEVVDENVIAVSEKSAANKGKEKGMDDCVVLEKDEEGLQSSEVYDDSFETSESRAERDGVFNTDHINIITNAVEQTDISLDERIDGTRKLQKTKMGDGTFVLTDRLLATFIHSGKSSSDRTIRVAEKKGFILGVAENQINNAVTLIAGVDLVGVIFKSAEGVSLGIGRCCSFLQAGHSEWSEQIEKTLLQDKVSQVRLDVYSIYVPLGQNKVHVQAYNNIGQLVVRGPCVETLKGDLVRLNFVGDEVEDFKSGYSFARDELAAVMESLYLSIENTLLSSVSYQTKMVGSKLPYIDHLSNKPFFLVEGTDNIIVATADLTEIHECPFSESKKCQFVGNLREIWQHVSAHLFLAEDIGREPVCALCSGALHVRKMDVNNERDIADKCEVTVVTPSNTTQNNVVIECKRYGRVEKPFAASGKSSKKSPSTNVPLKCSSCFVSKRGEIRGSYCWKYSMKKHYESVHPGAFSGDIANTCIITSEEKDMLKTNFEIEKNKVVSMQKREKAQLSTVKIACRLGSAIITAPKVLEVSEILYSASSED